MGRMVDAFIKWASARRPPQEVVTFQGHRLFTRYELLWRDEWPDLWWDRHKAYHPTRPNKLPWWKPFNAFIHCWDPEIGASEDFHDHPRWTVTLCIKGEIIERTPWGERRLKPGSVVIRSRKAIHAFAVPAQTGGEIWTLFIVGRREHRQNDYAVTPR